MQSRQRYCALQAVEPKWEISVVLDEPHRGQGTSVAEGDLRAKRTTSEPPAGAWLAHCGGAML